MAIKKAVVQVVILFDDQAVQPALFERSLSEIQEQMDECMCLGQSTLMSIEDVSASNLEQEQIALGDDGSFFRRDEESVPQP